MDRAERRTEILKAIGDSIGAAKGVDFSKETPENIAAGNELDQAMVAYIEGTGSKAEVRDKYRRWRDLHKTGASSQ